MKLPAGPTFQAGPILGLNLPAIRSAFTASSGMVIAVGAEVPGPRCPALSQCDAAAVSPPGMAGPLRDQLLGSSDEKIPEWRTLVVHRPRRSHFRLAWRDQGRESRPRTHARQLARLDHGCRDRPDDLDVHAADLPMR